MGTEGEKLAGLLGRLRGGQPRRHGQGDRDPVGGRARQDRRRDRQRRDARRQPDRHHLDGRVRRGRRPDADAGGPGRRGRLLPRRLGLHRGRRHVVRRPLVRRDPRPLLPHGPGREGRLGRGAAELGRAQDVRRGHGEQGRRRVRPQPPARPDRLVADDDAVRLVQRRRRSPTRTAPSTPSTPRRWPRRSTTTRRSSRRGSRRPGCSTPASSRAASPRARIGSFISGPWHTGLVEDAGRRRQDQYAVAPLPGQDAAPGTSFVGGGDLAVFNDSDNADNAWKYVQWLSRARDPAGVLRRGRRPAGRPGGLGDRRARRGPAAAGVRRSSSRTPQAPPAVPTWEQVAALDRRDHRAGRRRATCPRRGRRQQMQTEAASIGTGL